MKGLRKNGRKGVGIAELVVVIAVISIVSLIVVSFTLMVSDKVRNSREKVNAMNDITVIESIVEAWITENVEKGNDFYWFLDDGWAPNGDLDDTIILASFTDQPEDQDKYVFEYAIIDQKGTKQITCKMPDGQPVTYQTDTVESIHFNVGKKPDEGDIEDIIFFCTITYQVAVSNSNSVTHTYTFVINPRVGDKVGA